MSEFDSGGKGSGGKKDKGSSLWDGLRTVGRGILEGFSGSGTSAPAKSGARGGVKRKVDRRDPVEGERKVSAAQIRRSLKAWRDREQEAASVQRKPQIPSGGGAPLPGGVKSKMEGKLGADLSQVKVHTGGDSEKASEDLNAKAFTVGNDVHFNAGQFDPSNKEGEKLLAHELTHVVQGQKGGVQRKEDSDGGDAEGADGEAMEVSDPDEPAEKEADEVSEKVVSGDDEKDGESNEKPAKVSAKLSGIGTKIFRAVADAYAVAKAGGKHAGFLKNYEGKPKSEIQKGIASIEKQIAGHKEKIAHPEKALPNWATLDPRQQKALVTTKWPSDIERQSEQAEVLRGLLGATK